MLTLLGKGAEKNRATRVRLRKIPRGLFSGECAGAASRILIPSLAPLHSRNRPGPMRPVRIEGQIREHVFINGSI